MTGSDGPRRVAFADLPALAGQSLGTTAPVTITQQQVDDFAATTADHQWLHVDPVRAAAGPFGGTIVHGYLTVALSTGLLWQLLDVPDAVRVINYGLNRVRFPAPLPVGSAVQMSVVVTTVDAVGEEFQVGYTGTFTVPGSAKPVCVMKGLFRYYRRESAVMSRAGFAAATPER